MMVARITHAASASAPGLIVCMFVLAMTGCKTTGSTPGETKYGLFFSPTDHIEELLGQDNFQSASDVYEFEHEYFAEDSEKRKAIIAMTNPRCNPTFGVRDRPENIVG